MGRPLPIPRTHSNAGCFGEKKDINLTYRQCWCSGDLTNHPSLGTLPFLVLLVYPNPVRPKKGAPGRCLGVGWQVQLALGIYPGLEGGSASGREVAVFPTATGTGLGLAQSPAAAPLGLCLVLALDTHCPLGAGMRGA